MTAPIDHAHGQHMDGLAGDVPAAAVPAGDAREAWAEQNRLRRGAVAHADRTLALLNVAVQERDEARAQVAAAREAGRRERDAEVAGLLEALDRLGSMEAFAGARMVTPQDGELLARIDFARAALAAAPGPNGELGK